MSPCTWTEMLLVKEGVSGVRSPFQGQWTEGRAAGWVGPDGQALGGVEGHRSPGVPWDHSQQAWGSVTSGRLSPPVGMEGRPLTAGDGGGRGSLCRLVF